jgi:hypothetical protein
MPDNALQTPFAVFFSLSCQGSSSMPKSSADADIESFEMYQFLSP